MPQSKNDKVPTKQFVKEEHDKESECTAKYYGYFNGEFRKCLKERGLTESEPGPCKEEIRNKFEKATCNKRCFFG